MEGSRKSGNEHFNRFLDSSNTERQNSLPADSDRAVPLESILTLWSCTLTRSRLGLLLFWFLPWALAQSQEHNSNKHLHLSFLQHQRKYTD